MKIYISSFSRGGVRGSKSVTFKDCQRAATRVQQIQMFATFPQSLAIYFKCVCCIFGNCFATYLANVCDMVAVFNTNSTMTPLVWSTNRILSNAPVAMGNIRSAVLQFWINVQYVVQHPVKHDVKLFCKMFTKSSLSACHS